jgi:tetratricopeptide (TPR) repeat protein
MTMRILFVNLPTNLTFNVATPEQQPLGGMGSGTCYLARALTARGHDVTLATMLPEGTPPVLMGVRHISIETVVTDPLRFFRNNDYDAVIAVNYPAIAPYVKNASPRTVNIVWLHIFPDQPALESLGTVQGSLDAAVCVSATLRDAVRLSIPTVAIGNAIAPFFENMFASPDDLLAAKQNRAVYASMPFRGLDVLVEVMGRIKGNVALDVYSTMQTYQAGEKDFTPLFEAARRNPRITCHGGVGQQALAEAFRRAAFLAYPSTFIESSCIVALEAMAAGLKVISNDLGALPETTMGFADLLPIRGGAIARADHIAGITALLEKNEAAFRRDPGAWARDRFAQVQVINREATWSHRAAQWEELLTASAAALRGAADIEPRPQKAEITSTSVELQQAVLQHRMGNLAEAERRCAEALRLEPNDAMAHQFYGVLMAQRGQHAQALASFDRAVALNPSYAEAYNNRGIALCNLGRLEDGIASFDRAIANQPKAADVMKNRGMALGYLGRLEAALSSFDAALAVQPKFVEALVARGTVLHALRRHADALSSFDAALALRSFPELFYNRAAVLVELSRFTDALTDLDRALAARPNYADAWNNRGVVLQNLDRVDDAIASFDRAIALHPQLAAAHANRKSLLQRHGRL